ncbi:DUF4270 domain-containing protein [Flavobacterium sp. JP2137]|uniref:DUF4270 domain-containing protein n=1 Tax=Flavobacterium sp. JP2137 TaxID=3414510 RepID=UPI003D2FEA33
MNRKALLKGLLLSIGALSIQSCDKDFNTLGTGVIGEENFLMDKYTATDVVAYSQATGEANKPGAVETGYLPYNALGAFDDPVFGQTEANYVSQVSLPSANTLVNLGKNPKIDSVYVYVPYIVGAIETVNEKQQYPLPSTYGTGKFKLEVYENGYFLNNFSPDPSNPSRIYSDEKSKIEDFIKGTAAGKPLNDSDDRSQNDEFYFKNTPIKLYRYNKEGVIQLDETTGDPLVKQQLVAGLWLDLNKAHFEKMLFSPENQENLTNNNQFKSFFRGLYFKATSTGNSGAISVINFAAAELVVVYKQDSETAGVGRERKELRLKVSSDVVKEGVTDNTLITANYFTSTYNPTYLQKLLTPNKIQGDDKLFLKGGSGSLAVIELFKNNSTGTSEELEYLRKNKWLINDARLTFYVDKVMLSNGTQVEPSRIYLYDLNNNLVIRDYATDNTPQNTLYSKAIYGGILERESTDDKKGIRYRIKIADHINNLINKDSTNVKLGLAVSYDIDNVSTKRLKTPISHTPRDIKSIPTSSIMSPLGTVLYGSNNGDQDKKMKLEIFYTTPKN